MSNKGGRGQQRHQEANTTPVIKTSTLTLTRTPKPCYIRRSLFILFITFVLSSLFFVALLYSFFSIFLFLFAFFSPFSFVPFSRYFPFYFSPGSYFLVVSSVAFFISHSKLILVFYFLLYPFLPLLLPPSFATLYLFSHFPIFLLRLLSYLLSSTCTVSHFYFFCSLLPLFLLAPSFALNYLSRHFPNYLHPLH